MSPWPRWNSTEPSSGHSIRPSPPKCAADEAVLGRHLLVRRAEHEERGVPQEDEPAARAQQARGLGDPAVRVAPDRGAVLADREVERGVREGDRLRARLEEREDEAVLPLQRPRRLQLGRRDVDADRVGRRGGPARPRRTPSRSRARSCRGRRRRAGSAPPTRARPRCPSSAPAPPRRAARAPRRRRPRSSSRRGWRRRGRAARSVGRVDRSWLTVAHAGRGQARRAGRACRSDRGRAGGRPAGQGSCWRMASARSAAPIAKT